MRGNVPPQAYRNYAIRAPRETHSRPATCQEVDCLAFTNGWTLRKEDLSPELYHAATNSRRHYQEIVITEGHTVLQFSAGQPCFAEHRVSLERPAFYYAGPGTPLTHLTPRTFTTRRATKFDRADQWVDDMQTNLDRIRTIRERG